MIVLALTFKQYYWLNNLTLKDNQLMNLTQLKRELIKTGAVQRLQDLNHERELLLNIIDEETDSMKKAAKIIKSAANKKGFSYKGKHWTQTPKGRAKMREINLKRHGKI